MNDQLKIFQDLINQLELKLSIAKKNLDQGAGLKALDLIHQFRIKELETSILIVKLKQDEDLKQLKEQE